MTNQESTHTMTRELTPARPTHAAARKRRRGLRPAVWSLIGAGLVGGLIYAALPKPTAVDVTPSRRTELRVSIDEAGRTRVRDKFVVSAPLGADADRVTLRPGDVVHVGSELVRLSPLTPALLDPRAQREAGARLEAVAASERRARAGLKRAEIAAGEARAEATTERALADAGAIAEEAARKAELAARLAEEDLASARFDVQIAAHEVEVARAVANRATDASKADDVVILKSPIEGVVLRVLHQSAGPVQVATPLIELGDVGALEVVIDVLTSDAMRVAPMAQVSIGGWGGDRALGGHVRRVEPAAFTKLSALGVDEQRVSVIVDLDDPAAATAGLGDGFRVEASIDVWRSDDALVVPMTAVFREGSAFAVYVERDGRARLTPVEIGHRGAADVEIVAGLAAGARVIEHPGPKVADGARVAAR